MKFVIKPSSADLLNCATYTSPFGRLRLRQHRRDGGPQRLRGGLRGLERPLQFGQVSVAPGGRKGKGDAQLGNGTVLCLRFVCRHTQSHVHAHGRTQTQARARTRTRARARTHTSTYTHARTHAHLHRKAHQREHAH